MEFLVDTHILIWAAKRPERLSVRAARAIRSGSALRLISAATVWEIATKVRLGKLPDAVDLEAKLLESARANGYHFLDITPEIAQRAGRLPGTHRDPFDRIIAAHAIADDIPIISADPKLDGFGVRRIW